MSVAWVRVDDRLLHAQVLLGWAPRLAPRRIVLANDKVAADAGLGKLYRSLGEGDFEIDVLDVVTAAEQLRDPQAQDGTFLVLGSVQDARRLLESGTPLREIVLGGLHESPGTRQLQGAPIFLTREDARDLHTMLAHGVQLLVRDVPSAAGMRLDADMLASVWP